MTTDHNAPNGFCILPFIHLEIQIKGKVYSCCHSTEPQEIGDLYQEDLSDIWNGAKLSQMRGTFLKGDSHQLKHCKDCFYYEDLGAQSWREVENNNWSHEFAQALESKSLTPRSVAIRLSNLCNYSCRTCRPATSTGWFADAKLLNPKGDYKMVTSTPQGSRILEQLDPILEGLTQVHFAGGEPLMEKEHYLILEELLKRNPNVELSYDTNLSLLTLGQWNALELWKKFKKVNLSASIDGFGSQGEFIRKGLDWQNYLKHWELVKTTVPSVRMMMNFTLSIYNMFHVLDFIDEVIRLNLYQDQDPADLTISLVEEPQWQSLQALPVDIKKLVEQRYRDYGHRDFGKVGRCLDDAVRYMNAEDKSHMISTFRNFNFKLDLIRGERFEKLLPEEANLLGMD